MRISLRNNFLVKTQNTILSAAFVIALSTGLNAILGFVKSRLLASYFGVSDDLAVFYTADRIPSLIYSVLVVGAVSTVFIPVFTDLLKRNRKEAFETASSIINVTVIFFLFFGALLYIYASQVITLLAVGKFTPDQISLGTDLMRIMLVSQFILVFGSLATSVLQSFKYFIVPALAPVFYNVGMISGIILFSHGYGIYGPAIGVLLGAVLHFGIQLPLVLSTGFRFKIIIDLTNRGLKKIYSLVPPRITSVLMANLVGTINNSLAILISAQAVVYLKFAIQLQTLPVNLFGLSIASASLPTLSAESDKDQLEKFKKTFLTSFHQMLYFVVPFSVILLILRVPVVRIVYGVANFPWEATVKTAYILAFFSLSIFSQSANYLITRAFYALKDTMTPVKISLVTIFMNVGLSLTFVHVMGLGAWSIAFAFSVTSIADLLLLFYALHQKVGGFDLEKVIVPFVKIAYAAVMMGIMLYIPVKLLDHVVFDTTRTINLLLLTGVAGSTGMITYLLITRLFKMEEIQLIYKLYRKLNFRKVEKVYLPEAETRS